MFSCLSKTNVDSNALFDKIEISKSASNSFGKFFSNLSRPLSYQINESEYVITRLDEWENQLDHILPNFLIQNKIDQLGRAIEKKFAPLVRFNKWLNKEGEGLWYQQLATFLYKLPMRAIRNIIQFIYTIIKNALYTAVHPMKATIQLAKSLICLVNELLKPETWSKIGAGVIGAGLGQAVGSGNPLSVIGVVIGGAMLLGGLTAGALKEALEAERGEKIEHVKAYLIHQLKNIPEAMLTGFLLGLIMGGIQHGMQKHALQQQVNQFIKDHQLPQYSSFYVNDAGEIILKWEENLYSLKQMNSAFFNKAHFSNPKFFEYTQQNFTFAELKISSVTPELNVHFNAFGVWKWGRDSVTFNRLISLKDFLDHNWQTFHDVVIHKSSYALYG